MNFTSDGFILIWKLFPEYEDKLKKGFDAYLKDRALDIRKKRIIEAKASSMPAMLDLVHIEIWTCTNHRLLVFGSMGVLVKKTTRF